MAELFSSGSEESQSDDSQETGHREPEKGDSLNPNSPIMTFGELLKLAREIGDILNRPFLEIGHEDRVNGPAQMNAIFIARTRHCHHL